MTSLWTYWFVGGPLDGLKTQFDFDCDPAYGDQFVDSDTKARYFAVERNEERTLLVHESLHRSSPAARRACEAPPGMSLPMKVAVIA